MCMTFALHARLRGLCAEAVFERLSAIMSEDGSTRPPRAVLAEDGSTRPRRSTSPPRGSVLAAQGCNADGGGGGRGGGGGGGTATTVAVGGVGGAGTGEQRAEPETKVEVEVEAGCRSCRPRVEVAGAGTEAAAVAVGAVAGGKQSSGRCAEVQSFSSRIEGSSGCGSSTSRSCGSGDKSWSKRGEIMGSCTVVQPHVQIVNARVSRDAGLNVEGGLEREQRQAGDQAQQLVAAAAGAPSTATPAAAAADNDDGSSKERCPLLRLQMHRLQHLHPMSSGEGRVAPDAAPAPPPAGTAYSGDGIPEAKQHGALLSPRGLSPPASRQPSAVLLASRESSLAAAAAVVAGGLDRTETLSVIFA